MRAPERAETTLPTITADDLDGMAQNDVLYLSFRPLQAQFVLPDEYGLLTKITKNAGSDVNFHYIGRAAGGAYPYVIDADGHATGDYQYLNSDSLNALNSQLTAMFTGLGYTSHLGNDDHVSHDATVKFVEHGVVPAWLSIESGLIYGVIHDFGVVNRPAIYADTISEGDWDFYVMVDDQGKILTTLDNGNIEPSEVEYTASIGTAIRDGLNEIYDQGFNCVGSRFTDESEANALIQSQ